jgi:hypothetical protein
MSTGHGAEEDRKPVARRLGVDNVEDSSVEWVSFSRSAIEQILAEELQKEEESMGQKRDDEDSSVEMLSKDKIFAAQLQQQEEALYH